MVKLIYIILIWTNVAFEKQFYAMKKQWDEAGKTKTKSPGKNLCSLLLSKLWFPAFQNEEAGPAGRCSSGLYTFFDMCTSVQPSFKLAFHVYMYTYMRICKSYIHR